MSGGKQQASRKWAVATSEECIAVTAEGGPLLLYDFEVGSQTANSPAMLLKSGFQAGTQSLLRHSQAAYC